MLRSVKSGRRALTGELGRSYHYDQTNDADIMRTLRKTILIEWGFVAFLLVLCGILTALQYRWTGEVSRAEAARLRAGLAEQAQTLARDFDTELSEACAALRPGRAELSATNLQAAWQARWREWRGSNPRPIFRRIGVAVPSRSGVELIGPDRRAKESARWSGRQIGRRSANLRRAKNFQMQITA